MLGKAAAASWYKTHSPFPARKSWRWDSAPCYILTLNYTETQTTMFICHLTNVQMSPYRNLPCASTGSQTLWKTPVLCRWLNTGMVSLCYSTSSPQKSGATPREAASLPDHAYKKRIEADLSRLIHDERFSPGLWGLDFAETGNKALKSLMKPNLIPVHCFPSQGLLHLSMILVSKRQFPADKTFRQQGQQTGPT